MKYVYQLIGVLLLSMVSVYANENPTTTYNESETTTSLVSLQKIDSLQTIQAKEALITKLVERHEAFEVWFYVLISTMFLLIILFGIRCFKNRGENKQLQKIIALLEQRTTLVATTEKTQQYTLDIDDAIVTSILENLRVFEAERGFLASKITLHAIAKKMKTNTKYLSKVINTYKLKSFRNYINDLRIQYSVEKLKHTKSYRKYTIGALAQEAGFSTNESFTKAFRKSTGTTVSDFIKELN